MSRFLRTLVKAGLVEVDPETQARLDDDTRPSTSGAPAVSDDVDQLLKDTEALLSASTTSARPAPPPPPAGPGAARPVQGAAKPAQGAAKPPQGAAKPAPPPPAGASAGIAEGRALPEIYAEAGVPASPFPAEKLLRLVDGLKAMDPAMRKAAISAMDAADDAWSIEDPVQDAQRKIIALDATKQRVGTFVGESEARAATELQAADAHQKEATEKIRAQIAELEALLEEELASVATRRAEIQARVQATREAAAREGARLDQEIAALRTILDAFGR